MQNKVLRPEQKKRLDQFLERFQGKVSQIQKDGHLGVVARTDKPIEKVEIMRAPQAEKQQAILLSDELKLSQKDESNFIKNMKGKKILTRGKIAIGKRHESQDDLNSKDTDYQPKVQIPSK